MVAVQLEQAQASKSEPEQVCQNSQAMVFHTLHILIQACLVKASIAGPLAGRFCENSLTKQAKNIGSPET